MATKKKNTEQAIPQPGEGEIVVFSKAMKPGEQYRVMKVKQFEKLRKYEEARKSINWVTLEEKQAQEKEEDNDNGNSTTTDQEQA